jgi:hypothetical protein
MMVLRDTLKRELDNLNETELSRISEFILSLKWQARNIIKTTPFWESASPKERSQDFLEWVSGLNKTGTTLADEAFDRTTIYEE